MLGTGFAVLSAWQLVRWLFAVPVLVFEAVPHGVALSRRSALTQGRLGHILLPLLLWWLALTVVAILVAWLGPRLDLTRHVAVTAHRGASAIARENSMVADSSHQ